MFNVVRESLVTGLFYVLFFLVVVPIGLLRRVAGRLILHPGREAQNSTLKERNHTFSREDLLRTF